MMHKYTSGKIPKAFSMIPNLHNWEEVLLLTDPEKWSALQAFQAFSDWLGVGLHFLAQTGPRKLCSAPRACSPPV